MAWGCQAQKRRKCCLGRIRGGDRRGGGEVKSNFLALPGGVPQQEKERLFGRPTEVLPVNGRHDVCVAVQEPHELLQAPETALTGAEHALQCVIFTVYTVSTSRNIFLLLAAVSHLDDRVVLAVLLEPLLYELDHDADEPDDGDDEGAKRERAEVVPGGKLM